jgi:hypothetical protein
MVAVAGFTHHDSINLRSIGPRYVRTPRLRRSAHYFLLSRCSGTSSPNRPRYVNTSHGTVGTDVRQQVTFSNLQKFDINATPLLAFSEYLPDRGTLRKVRELIPSGCLDIRLFFAIILAHG